MRHDPVFAAMARDAVDNHARHLREQLREEARAAYPHAPEWFREQVAQAHVQIAGWKTPALPTTCRRK